MRNIKKTLYQNKKNKHWCASFFDILDDFLYIKTNPYAQCLIKNKSYKRIDNFSYFTFTHNIHKIKIDDHTLSSPTYDDWRLHSLYIKAFRAYINMCKSQNIINQVDAEKIILALHIIKNDIKDEKINLTNINAHNAQEAIYHLLKLQIGNLAYNIYIATSIMEYESVIMKMWVRDAIESLSIHLYGLQKSFLDKSEQNIKTIFPIYMQSQSKSNNHVSFGYYLSRYVRILNRDKERFHQCFKSIDKCVYGAYSNI